MPCACARSARSGPTAEPTAPEAAATTTVRGRGRYRRAGIGGLACRHADRGRYRRNLRSIRQPLAVRDRGSASRRATARSRPGKAGLLEAMTSLTVPPSITPPIAPAGLDYHRSCARAYRDRATARWCAQHLARTGASERVYPAESEALGSPTGERRERALCCDMIVSPVVFVIASQRSHERAPDDKLRIIHFSQRKRMDCARSAFAQSYGGQVVASLT